MFQSAQNCFQLVSNYFCSSEFDILRHQGKEFFSLKVGSEPNITRLLHVITILRPRHQASRRMKGWECS